MTAIKTYGDGDRIDKIGETEVGKCRGEFQMMVMLPWYVYLWQKLTGKARQPGWYPDAGRRIQRFVIQLKMTEWQKDPPYALPGVTELYIDDWDLFCSGDKVPFWVYGKDGTLSDHKRVNRKLMRAVIDFTENLTQKELHDNAEEVEGEDAE